MLSGQVVFVLFLAALGLLMSVSGVLTYGNRVEQTVTTIVGLSWAFCMIWLAHMLATSPVIPYR